MDRTFRTSTSTSLVRAFAIGGVLLTGLEATGFGSTAFAAETSVAQDAAEARDAGVIGELVVALPLGARCWVSCQQLGQTLFRIDDHSPELVACKFIATLANT